MMSQSSTTPSRLPLKRFKRFPCLHTHVSIYDCKPAVLAIYIYIYIYTDPVTCDHVGSQGNFCCLLSDFILGYFLNMKAVKELYERRQEKKIRDRDVFYILHLVLGLSTI